jgi:hypothetical protein
LEDGGVACFVKILKVVGQTKGGVLVAIKIVGSADPNCGAIDITVLCDGLPRSFTASVTEGAWSITFPPGDPREHPCQCGSPIDVRAICLPAGCKDTWSGVLDCQEISPCPSISFDSDPVDKDSRCDPGGTRTVTGSVIVAPDPSNPVGATVYIDAVAVSSHPPSTSPYTINYSAPMTPGKHSVMVTPTDPACGSSSNIITVPPCPGSEACPKVELVKVTPGDCRDTKRLATVVVKVTPVSGPTGAELLHGKSLDKGSSGGPFTLTGTDEFSPGGDPVTVTVTAPPGCPPTSLIVKVDPCPGTTGGGDGGGDDGGDDGGCIVGRIFVALLLAAALFLTLIGLCVPGAGTAFLIAAGAAAAAGAIAFGLWWLLCGTKCGALMLAWEIPMIGAWVCGFLATCCPLALALAIGLGAAAAGLFALWLSQCKPSKCRILFELLWVFVSALAPIFLYLAKVALCGYPPIPLIAGGIAAALGIALGAAGCVKK